MNTKTLFSSNKMDWETPQPFFNEVSRYFGPFDLDAAASMSNTKAYKFISINEDALGQNSWDGNNIWLNPPYGLSLKLWVKRAYEESRRDGVRVTCLIPSRTDTKYWHEYCMKGLVYFIRGRLTFRYAKGPAPFPSAIVLFCKDLIPYCDSWPPKSVLGGRMLLSV